MIVFDGAYGVSVLVQEKKARAKPLLTFGFSLA